MYHTNKKDLTEQLDSAIEKGRASFTPGLLSRLSRIGKDPKTVLWRKLFVDVLKQKYRFTIKSKMFYGEDFYADNLEHEIAYTGTTLSKAEMVLTRYFIDQFTPQDVFLDVGANYGFFTALASDMGVSQVHAFEPSKINFSILNKNARTRSNVRANEVAVYSKTGKVVFFDGATANSTTVPELVDKIGREVHRVEVPAITLDEYCKEHNVSLTIIKIDIEGAEIEALFGAQMVLQKYSPIIILEVLPSDYFSDNLKAPELLMGMGYQPFKIIESGELELMHKFTTPTKAEEWHENIVFKK